jgi:hypothetical protein
MLLKVYHEISVLIRLVQNFKLSDLANVEKVNIVVTLKQQPSIPTDRQTSWSSIGEDYLLELVKTPQVAGPRATEMAPVSVA